MGSAVRPASTGTNPGLDRFCHAALAPVTARPKAELILKNSGSLLPAILASTLDDGDIAALAAACHSDPFKVLGRHRWGDLFVVRTFLPGAEQVTMLVDGAEYPMVQTESGLFEVLTQSAADYTFRISWGGHIIESADPYVFGPLLTDFELHLIAQGNYLDLPLRLGSNLRRIDNTNGVMFATWAPNASSVSVVGAFNSWDPRRHPMRFRREAGIWELFIPNLGCGEIYKYAIVDAHGERLPWKADPLARQAELPPRTASVVAARPDFVWTDDQWLKQRAQRQSVSAPISIYEVHVESWLRTHDGQPLNWDAAIERLIPYARHLGFTHLELMPIAEHPFGGSWGYQPLSLFAPTARLGDPASFARFVDACHAAEIGVIVDWVPAHFPSDAHGLARYDGTALYEHEDPREGFHHDWNTSIYNAGRHEVRGFLIASALWWLERFHVDGLRVDAVASMLYRDYSRPADAWISNHHGGRENYENIAFLKELNATVAARCPGATIMAEESTAWPGVTSKDGLGFDFKWNMGWMHDTLRYFSRDPVHRGYHLEDITFGLHYGFSEAFILPLSHDEVVHGKGSLLQRMPGDDWQKFAHLRLLLSLMWTHPGKKLLFMTGEFGAEAEWNVDAPFPWPHPDDSRRQGLARMVADLNRLYRTIPQLHQLDREPRGFSWKFADDATHAVLAFSRSAGQVNDEVLIVLNTTPVPRHDYCIGVGVPGRWREIFNSDAESYGGSNLGNLGSCDTEATAANGQPHSLRLILPPLAAIVLVPPDQRFD
jgi:1,4-alpha-glucan branching enzyme